MYFCGEAGGDPFRRDNTWLRDKSCKNIIYKTDSRNVDNRLFFYLLKILLLASLPCIFGVTSSGPPGSSETPDQSFCSSILMIICCFIHEGIIFPHWNSFFLNSFQWKMRSIFPPILWKISQWIHNDFPKQSKTHASSKFQMLYNIWQPNS